MDRFKDLCSPMFYDNKCFLLFLLLKIMYKTEIFHEMYIYLPPSGLRLISVSTSAYKPSWYDFITRRFTSYYKIYSPCSRTIKAATNVTTTITNLFMTNLKFFYFYHKISAGSLSFLYPA